MTAYYFRGRGAVTLSLYRFFAGGFWGLLYEVARCWVFHLAITAAKLKYMYACAYA